MPLIPWFEGKMGGRKQLKIKIKIKSITQPPILVFENIFRFSVFVAPPFRRFNETVLRFFQFESKFMFALNSWNFNEIRTGLGTCISCSNDWLRVETWKAHFRIPFKCTQMQETEAKRGGREWEKKCKNENKKPEKFHSDEIRRNWKRK